MAKYPPLKIGEKFNRLTVVAEAARDKAYRRKLLVRCDCGTEKIVDQDALRTGKTKSCGCLQRYVLLQRSVIHGFNRQGGRKRLYSIWATMLSRCRDQNCSTYYKYGARGIAVCERWSKFENFLADMGEPPTAKHTLDRKDNLGNYEPGNCRWATAIEQQNNTRRNRVLTLLGQSDTVANWCRRLGLKPGTVSYRVHHGWSDEKALLVPT